MLFKNSSLGFFKMTEESYSNVYFFQNKTFLLCNLSISGIALNRFGNRPLGTKLTHPQAGLSAHSCNTVYIS